MTFYFGGFMASVCLTYSLRIFQGFFYKFEDQVFQNDSREVQITALFRRWIKQNIMKPLRILQALRSLKSMWKLEAAYLSLLDKYRKWRYHFCHSTKEYNQERSGCRPSFPQEGLDSFFANISNIPFIGRRHQFQTSCFSFYPVQKSAINISSRWNTFSFCFMKHYRGAI